MNPQISAQHFAAEGAAQEELHFDTQWDDPNYNYADLSTRLEDTRLDQRGRNWWKAAHDAYMDRTRNFAWVREQMNVMKAYPTAMKKEAWWRRDYRQLRDRWLRMEDGTDGAFFESGINPMSAFGSEATLTDFYEVGRQQLRLHLHSQIRQLRPHSVYTQHFANAAGARQAALTAPPPAPPNPPANPNP